MENCAYLRKNPGYAPAALRYYATASFLKVLGDTMGISKASASRCVHDVAECLCEMAQDWIKFPTASGDINVNKYDL